MSDFIPDSEQLPIEPEVAAVSPPLTLHEAKEKFSHALEATDENNTFCVRDRKYVDGDQLTPTVRAELKKRGQPEFVNNKIAPAVNGILGIIDAADSEPEAFPRNLEGRDAADTATKVLRYIADDCQLPDTLDFSSKEFLIEGTCAAIVLGDDDSVWVEPIAWRDFFYDPESTRHDFKDARYLGMAKWLDIDVVEGLYPETYAAIGSPFDENDFTTSEKELKERKTWVDSSRKRLRVVEMYYVDGKGIWHRFVFCRGGFLDYGVSEYMDDDGRPVCPIIAVSYEITQNNERYGVVRNMVGLQDEVNARRSKMLHLINSRQVRQTDQMAPSENMAIAKSEAAKADGVIPFGYEVVQTADMASGQMTILQQSLSDLDRLAPTPAVLGRSSGANESGRSRQILQEAGYTELARNISRFENFEVRIYRQMWLRAKQFWKAQRYVRVTNEMRAPEFIAINKPIMGEPQPQYVPGPDGQPLFGPDGMPVVQLVPTVMGYENRLAEMEMDISVDRVPTSMNLQQETFKEVAGLAASLQLNPLDPAFVPILRLSGLPNTRRIIEELEAAREEQAKAAEAQQQMAQAEMQVEGQVKQAKAAKDMASAEKYSAEAERTKMELDREALITASVFNDPYGRPQFPGY